MTSTHAHNIAAIIRGGDTRTSHIDGREDAVSDLDKKLAAYRRQVGLPPIMLSQSKIDFQKLTTAQYRDIRAKYPELLGLAPKRG